MTEQNDARLINPQDCPYYLVTRVGLVMTSAFKKCFLAAGVGHVKPAYLGVLWCLWREEGAKMIDLARCAGLEPSTLTGLLDRMERDGYVKREADPHDRRVFQIFLTEEGRKIRDIVIRMVDETLALLFDGVEETELAQMKKVLLRVLDNARGESGA